MNTEEVLEYLHSDKGKQSVQEYARRLVNRKSIERSQLQRFHKNYSERFEEITEKILTKYNSKSYAMRWLNRGIEPPEYLLYFLFEYAVLYGRQAEEAEWEKYGNMFTTELYYVKGYYFNLMLGQGCALKVHKAE